MSKKLSEGMVMAVDRVNEKGDADFSRPGEPDSDDTADDMDEMALKSYAEGLAESIPAGASASDFAAPPKGLYVGDAKHAGLAVQAVTRGFRGNKAKSRSDPGVKGRVASAIRKYYKGDMQKYYLTWLHSGKKPSKRPAAEMHRVSEIAIATPHWSAQDEENFPDPPITPGVDVDRLTASDRMNNEKPLFVTRPLAIEGGLSDNNLRYTAEMLDEIYQQVLSKRPPGRLGHVSETNRSWEVPPDSCLWVGALDVPDDKIFGKRTVYGKAYIYPNAALHEMIEKRSAAGTPLSNSIWGLADLVDNEDGTVSSQSTDIESIDFVSPERAALKALGGDFKVTSEMAEGDKKVADDDEEVGEMFKKGLAEMKPAALHEALHEAGHAHEVAKAHIALHEANGTCSGGAMHEMFSREGRAKMCETHLREESTPEETYKMLSEAQRAHCAECYAKEQGQTMKPVQEEVKEKESIGEMTSRISEMEKTNGDLKQRISELEKVNKGHERADFERALDARIETYFVAEIRTDKGKEVVSNLKRQMRKGTLAEMAGMENGQIVANIETACQKIWDEDTKSLAEMAYAGLQGPAAVVNAPRNPNAGNRLGVDAATGHFGREFMQDAKLAAQGAVRSKGGAK